MDLRQQDSGSGRMPGLDTEAQRGVDLIQGHTAGPDRAKQACWTPDFTVPRGQSHSPWSLFPSMSFERVRAICFKDDLFERQHYRKRDRDRDLSTGTLPKWPQQLELGQNGARSFSQVLTWMQELSTLAIFCSFPRCTSRELNQKWSIQDSNKCL